MNELPGDTLAGNPDDALLERLVKLHTDGKSAEAIQQLDGEIAHRPLSPALYFIRGLLLQMENKQFDAIVEFNRALSLAPGMVSALVQRGWARARMNDLQGAMADTDQALALAPGYPSALLNKALLLIGAGQRDEGMRMLDDMVRASDNAGELLVIRAQLLIAEGETDEALSDLARVNELLPENPQAYLLRADILIRREDHEAALAEVDKAIEMGSAEVDLLLWRAILKQRLGDQVGTEEAFRAYAEKNPLRAAEALRLARVNLTPDTSHVTALMMEMQEHMLRNDGAAMEKVADQLLQLTPEDSRLYGIKAMAAFQRLDCDQGSAFVERMPPDQREALPIVGTWSACLVRQGKGEEALPLTTKLVAMAPKHREALYTHAEAQMINGRFEEAAVTARSLVALESATEDDRTVLIRALNYARKREDAARLTIDFIRQYGSENKQIIHVILEMASSLERDPTWPLAIELLSVFEPPHDKEDSYNYLMARGHMHKGEITKALAALARIKSIEASPAMVDGAFRELWDNPEFTATFDPATSRRKGYDRVYSQHVEDPGSLADAVELIENMGELGCRPEALAEMQRLIKIASLREDWSSGGVYVYLLAGRLQRETNDFDAAAKTYDESLKAITPLLTAELLLDYARVMVATGQHAKAVILADLALKRGITPFGKVIAHGLRAFAFEGLGDIKGRKEALDYLEAHWSDNLEAAMDALGLLHSYDGLVGIIVKAVTDPERSRHVLRHLNRPTGAPIATEYDRRIAAFVDRLRSDPRVLDAVAGVGRIKPPTYQATCPLTPQELAERPMRFQLEGTAAADSAATPKPPQRSISSGQ